MTVRAGPFLAVSVGAGVLGAIQPKINTELGDRVGSALVASLVNFTVALVLVAVVLSMRPSTRGRLRNIRTWPVPWWTFAAGIGGVLVVVAGAVAVKTIGVAIFSVAFFAGQIAFGLGVDRLGVSPGGVRRVSARRGAAAALAMGAVGLAQIGRPVGDFAPGLVAFVVASGAGVAFQSAFNGRIAHGTGDPMTATAVNVAVGTATLAVIVAAAAGVGVIDPLDWPSAPWLYVGGAMGMLIVLALAAATAALGVLRSTLAMLAAQLVTAFAVDWLSDGERPTIGVVAGGLIVAVAVALARSAPESGNPTPQGPSGRGGPRSPGRRAHRGG